MAKNARILIVEDDAHELQGLADLLSVWGYETETAGDGSEALDKVSSFNPAVVISDLRMPRMTGMELLRQVHEVHSGLNFIMLTGQGTIEEAWKPPSWGLLIFSRSRSTPSGFKSSCAIAWNATKVNGNWKQPTAGCGTWDIWAILWGGPRKCRK